MAIARDVDSRLHASIERQVRKITSISLAGALVVGYAWLLLETHTIAGTTDFTQTVTAIPTVLFDTRFGQILVLQALAIACARVAVWRGRDILAASLAGTAVSSKQGTAMPSPWRTSPTAVGDAAPDSRRRLARRVASPSDRGARRRSTPRILPHSASLASVRSRSACLPPPRFFRERCFRAVLTGLTGTAYGAVLLLKAFLFAVFIAIAAVNHFRLTPAFAGPDAEKARRALASKL